MKGIAAAVLAAAMVFGLGTSVMAQNPLKPKVMNAVGKLTKIDGKDLTLSVKMGDKSVETEVTCNDATKFFYQETSDAKAVPAKFEDLKVGDTVKARFNADKVALDVTFRRAAPAAATAPAAPAK